MSSYITGAKGICFVARAAGGAISKLVFVNNGEFDESQRGNGRLAGLVVSVLVDVIWHTSHGSWACMVFLMES